MANSQNKHVYQLPQSKLKGIKSYPFIYWISDEFREKFGEKLLDDVVDIKQGIATSNNNRFLRYWWEIIGSNQSYYPYSKEESMLNGQEIYGYISIGKRKMLST